MFAKKLLRVTFQLASGTFTGTGANTLQVSGLRTRAQINKAGALSGCTLNLEIYGLTLSQMNDLSTLGMQIQLQPRNLVMLEASSDDGESWSTVFSGAIINSYTDGQSMPDVPFRVDANTIGAVNIIGAPVTSVKGAANVADVLASLATSSGLNFENNGVSVVVRNPYLYGSYNDQIKDLCQSAGIGWVIDDGTLAIFPKNGSRGGEVPVVSAATGMVGFPGYTANGLLLKTLYNPAIVFQGSIQVESRVISSLTPGQMAARGLPANGVWAIAELDHTLESWVPGGQWFSSVYAYNPAFAPPVLPSA